MSNVVQLRPPCERPAPIWRDNVVPFPNLKEMQRRQVALAAARRAQAGGGR